MLTVLGHTFLSRLVTIMFLLIVSHSVTLFFLITTHHLLSKNTIMKINMNVQYLLTCNIYCKSLNILNLLT